jgi:hypothetical protein
MLEQGVAGSDSIMGNRAVARPASRPGRNWLARCFKFALGRWPRIMNIGLLIAGFALGQGAILVVQTSLVAAGEYELLAGFGTHYSFAMLGIIMVDGGASTILVRAVVRSSAEQTSRDDVWQIFCEISAIRLLIASLIGVTAGIYALGIASDGFSRWYVAFALPGLLAWAGNAVGLLDGLKLSGISGISGSAAYIVTAIGLAVAAHRSAETAGAILGGAFSLGYLVTLGAQWVALGRKGWFLRFQRITRAGLVRSLKDSSALLFQLLPGQINMRVQLVLSTVYLGAETTALFIYAKQVVTACTQIIAFVLRVDFPGLVEKVAGSRERSVRIIFDAQKTTLLCAVVFTVGAAIVFGTAAIVPDFSLHRAATTVLPLTPTILTLSLSLVMIQGLAAMGAYAVIAKTFTISLAIAIFVSCMLVRTLDVYAFVLGEMTFHLVAAYLVYRNIR